MHAPHRFAVSGSRLTRIFTSRFQNLKIFSKLLFSFLVVLALTVFVSLFSMAQLQKVNHTATDLESRWLPSVRGLLEIKAGMAQLRAEEMEHILANDEVKMRTHQMRMGDLIQKLTAVRSDYEKLPITPEERAIYAEIVKLWDEFKTEHDNVISLSAQNKKDEAIIFNRGSLTRLYGEMREHIDSMVQLGMRNSLAASRAGSEVYEDAQVWVAAMLTGTVVLGLLFALSIARLVSRPLQQAVSVARKVAGGDLRTEIVQTSTDETGQLMAALKEMNDALKRIVSEVRTSSDAIAASSSEIATGNADLSSRTEQQAGSLEETAASIEELTATVKQNAENASQANQLASAASSIAEQGGKVVTQVVSTMGEINASAKKIVDIIGVIDGIAFQTNILALNAAVEAARAGEQGRGFAVVASEVRSLAQRSATAAREIKALIDDSVNKVATGSRLVDQAGATMTEVVSSVQRVGTIVAEISTASQEQSIGIQQIGHSMSEMDEMTQQNAALVEEAGGAAEALESQTRKMADLVRIFKLQDEQDQQDRDNADDAVAKQAAPAISNARSARGPLALVLRM
ncbi:methyl-accepting chemotaxis protein [Noviherbaspirillum sp. CPCC 100848]|uniref:Methyl-accepting chemotaxis protein n=1 Tax=Noviherbaspirillum album TaxID=3080276 RepID=A0ABU6JE18_9BURK|nr:methyl-accepting chemotaxis protein [Noviherbaspirillum sp. CPCC 100848]MEC4721785.1 methyl-accepting chemotaxis protein [Noviherbaspirillum sp. CPCC 100848]